MTVIVTIFFLSQSEIKIKFFFYELTDGWTWKISSKNREILKIVRKIRIDDNTFLN